MNAYRAMASRVLRERAAIRWTPPPDLVEALAVELMDNDRRSGQPMIADTLGMLADARILDHVHDQLEADPRAFGVRAELVCNGWDGRGCGRVLGSYHETPAGPAITGHSIKPKKPKPGGRFPRAPWVMTSDFPVGFWCTKHGGGLVTPDEVAEGLPPPGHRRNPARYYLTPMRDA